MHPFNRDKFIHPCKLYEHTKVRHLALCIFGITCALSDRFCNLYITEAVILSFVSALGAFILVTMPCIKFYGL